MMSDAHGDPVHEIYHTGLRNMHALEMTAIEMTECQVERLEHYPEMAARLKQHHLESEEQARRLEVILNRHGSSSSGAKNAVTSVMGNVAAALHTPAPDEVLKNTFANYAFEHQEIAAYTSLIAMAERVGDSASIGPLRQSLAEEETMAKYIQGQIVPTTARYMELTAAGEKAKV
jgi:ferritin-like metal-binding protein YciE